MITKKLILGIILFSLSVNSFAGNVSSTIGNYIVTTYGKAFIHMNSATVSAPSCSGASDWAIDLIGTNGTAGRALLAAIITASIQGKTIAIYGTGDCSVWGDRETISYVVFS
jgi:hypothetical protein